MTTRSFNPYPLRFGQNYGVVLPSGSDDCCPPNIVTLEQFGAVGNGIADDSAAMTAAIAAISVPQGGTILLGTRTYNIGAGAPYVMPANTSIRGQGENSVLFTDQNSVLIQISNGEHIGLYDMALLGNGIGAAQVGVANGPLPGAPGSSTFRMSGVSITNFALYGFIAFNQTVFPGTFQGNILSDVRIQGCGTGFFFADEYIVCSNCIATACTVAGVVVSAGNVTWVGGDIINNAIGVDLSAIGNDAHGIFSGTQINHNVTSIRAITIQNGESFIGCHIFSEGAGGIVLTNANGITFEDCVLDVVKYDIDSSNGVVFRNNQIFGVYTNTINNLNATSALWEENINLLGTPFSNQLLPFTFAADADQQLTAKESIAEDIVVNDGVILNVRTITSQTTPDLARPIFIRNNQAVLAINFAWAAGASVNIPAGTSARIASDGLAAVVMMRGT